MSGLLTELSARARLLPTHERAQLAQGLLESLQEVVAPDVEAAWDDAIRQRVDEYERGVAVLSPAADVFLEARHLAP